LYWFDENGYSRDMVGYGLIGDDVNSTSNESYIRGDSGRFTSGRVDSTVDSIGQIDSDLSV